MHSKPSVLTPPPVRKQSIETTKRIDQNQHNFKPHTYTHSRNKKNKTKTKTKKQETNLNRPKDDRLGIEITTIFRLNPLVYTKRQT